VFKNKEVGGINKPKREAVTEGEDENYIMRCLMFVVCIA
jgi:hypothetical protein